MPLVNYRPCIPMNNPLGSWRVWISFWNIVHPNKKIFISRIPLMRYIDHHDDDEDCGNNFKYDPTRVLSREADHESGAQLLVPNDVTLQEVKDWITWFFGKYSMVKPIEAHRPHSDLSIITTTERMGFYVPWSNVKIPLEASVFDLVPNFDKHRFNDRKYDNSSDVLLTSLGWMSLAEMCSGWIVPLGTEGILFEKEEDYAMTKVIA